MWQEGQRRAAGGGRGCKGQEGVSERIWSEFAGFWGSEQHCMGGGAGLAVTVFCDSPELQQRAFIQSSGSSSSRAGEVMQEEGRARAGESSALPLSRSGV